MSHSLSAIWEETGIALARSRRKGSHRLENLYRNLVVRYFGWLIVIVLITAFAGCDAGTAPAAGSIHGEITLNKQRVDNGVIAFLPLGEAAARGMASPIKQGQYFVKLEGGRVAIGDYAVRISARRTNGQAANDSDNHDVRPIAPKDDYIPATYNTRSTLKVSVDDPNREYVVDFHMSK